MKKFKVVCLGVELVLGQTGIYSPKVAFRWTYNNTEYTTNNFSASVFACSHCCENFQNGSNIDVSIDPTRPDVPLKFFQTGAEPKNTDLLIASTMLAATAFLFFIVSACFFLNRNEKYENI